MKLTDQQALVWIGIPVGMGIIAIGAYYLARFLRGTIRLTLPRTAFNPGDKIAGSFELHIKKPVQGNKLMVSLIGVETTTSQQGGKQKTRSREIYRDQVLLEDARLYAAGARTTYQFELPTPNMQSPEFLNSVMGQAVATAVRLLSNRSTRLKWKVEARLDASGVDLVATKPVSINVHQLM